MNRFFFWFSCFVLAIGWPMGSTANDSAEVADVARSILANSQWVADAKLCPVKVMATREAKDHLSSNKCEPGRLSSCLATCAEGSSGSCYWLAYALQQRDAPSQSYEALYQRSCKLGTMSGCTNRAAGMLRESKEDEATLACAAATFEAVCAFDDPWACTMQALHLSRGMGVKRDVARALTVLEKSCKYGPEDQACIYGNRIRRDIQAKR